VVGLLIGGTVGDRVGAVRVVAERASTMSQLTDRDKETLLQAFADAWNRHDVDALMSVMSTDCVFQASGGNMVDGERHEGQRAVRVAYAAVFEQYPDAHWGNPRHFVTGDRGVSEWTFTGTLKDGKRVEITGCDLFTFLNGKIAIKNSFRKNRPPIGEQDANTPLSRGAPVHRRGDL
jgi:ketosteroid isomerase-like protein